MARFIYSLLSFLFTYQLLLAQAPAIQWQKCIGGTDMDIAQVIQQTSDGGYVVAGSTKSLDGDVSGYHFTNAQIYGSTNAYNDVLIIKVNGTGIIQWQKCLGGSGEDVAYSIQQTADGGYILAGYTSSDNGDVSGNHGNTDAWIVKLTSTGSIQWQKCLGGSGFNGDVAYSVRQTSDGGYIMAGSTTSFDGDVSGIHSPYGRYINDMWVVKLNGSGNIQWQRCLGGSEDDWGYSIQQTTDGGYIIAGASFSTNGSVTGNVFVVKLSNAGAIDWQKLIGGSGFNETANSVQQTSDGGYIVAGKTNSADGDITGYHVGSYSSTDIWVVKLTGTGTIQWQKCLGGSQDETTQSIQQTTDGGYIIAGKTSSNDGDVSGYHASGDVWVIRLSSIGSVLWQKCYGGSSGEEAYSIQQTSDGGYILAGYTSSNNGDVSGLHVNGSYLYYDMWIAKLASGPLPQTIQHFHQLTSNTTFSTRKLLGTIPEKATFGVCADSSEASVFKFFGGGKNYSQAAIEKLGNVSQYGSFSIISQTVDSLVVRYRHPSFLNPTSTIISFTVNLTVPGSSGVSFQLSVYRAPVLMVHGLWSDSSSFNGLEKSLVSSGFYTNDFTRRVNYRSTNYVSFNLNKAVIPDNINALIAQVRDKGIAAGKVDIMGHSMGGILSRLYLQSALYRNDIHKLITINTPHSGSQMGNVLLGINNFDFRIQSVLNLFCLTAGQLLNNTLCVGGAIDDLRVDSPAIRDDLNGSRLKAHLVPSHAIVTIQNPTADITLNTEDLALMDKAYVFKLILRDIIQGNFNIIFNPDIEDDIIVAASSQKGGLSGSTTSLVHDQIHMGSPANEEVIEIVKTLLGADPNGDKFTQNGFNPVPLNYVPQWRKFTSGGGRLAASNASLSITSPRRGSIVRLGTPLLISSNSTGLNSIKTIIQYDNQSVQVGEKTNSPAAYTTTAGGYIGKHTIIVIGQTSAGDMIADSSFYYVSNNFCLSLQSGEWSTASTWSCGHEPTVKDIVVINPAHTVTVSTTAAQALQLNYNGGRIQFAPGVSKVFVKAGGS